jgi:hypothetical protein
MNNRRLRLASDLASETRPEAIPAIQRRCRAGHHDFPMDHWLPPAPVPRGVTVMFASEGRYKLVELCSACQAVTGVTYTHPGGAVDGHLRRQIVYSSEWVKLAQGVPRSKGLIRETLYADGREQLEAFIGRAITTLTAEYDEPEARGVPPVILRST